MANQHVRLSQAVGNMENAGDEVEPVPAGMTESERMGRSVEPAHVVSSGAAPAGGREIANPSSGERIVIRESGAATGGRLLSFDIFLPPGAHVPARHVHPVQQEQFTVVAGQMRFRLGRFGRRTILAQPGDTVLVPAGTAHWFGNAGAGVTQARVEVRPALRMEEMLETSAAMRPAGYVPGVRMPRVSEFALFLSEFQRELAVPDVPARLVRMVLAPLAWLGRRRDRVRHAPRGAIPGSGAIAARHGDTSAPRPGTSRTDRRGNAVRGEEI